MNASLQIAYKSALFVAIFCNATLEIIFSHPAPTNMEWRRIEGLFLALGATPVEGSGSRVRFLLNDVVATFHRPHPAKKAKAYQIRDVRAFLENAGKKP